MRAIVFFDMPTVTKRDVKIYSKFRKYLIKSGYLMMQYSIYSKLFPNREAMENHLKQLRRNVPNQGQVRVMKVTEKQYAAIEVLVGTISQQESLTNQERVIIL